MASNRTSPAPPPARDYSDHHSYLKQYTRAAHADSFVEVEVDEQIGILNVTRGV